MKFLFVDRITDLQPGERIVGEKTLRPDEPYLKWHFPERPILPGNLIVEAASQLAGWLVAASTDFEGWTLLQGVERARFSRFVQPGETVAIEVTCDAVDGDEIRYAFVARVDDTVCASAECVGARVPLAELDDPDDVRRAFETLRAEEVA